MADKRFFLPELEEVNPYEHSLRDMRPGILAKVKRTHPCTKLIKPRNGKGSLRIISTKNNFEGTIFKESNAARKERPTGVHHLNTGFNFSEIDLSEIRKSSKGMTMGRDKKGILEFASFSIVRK